MLTTYLNIYLTVIIISALVLGLIILKTKKPPFSLFLSWILIFIILPIISSYIYTNYFTGLSEVAVPDLAGMPIEIAVDNVKILNLRIKSTGTVSETNQPWGCIVTQRPEAGKIVKAGRTIKVILSSKELVSAEPSEEAISLEGGGDLEW